jgi:capsular exopolysaccharide synthesis family protein
MPNRFSDVTRLYARLHRYRVILAKHWWVPVLSLVVVFCPVAYYANRSPSLFASKAKMWMPGKINLPEGRVYSEEVSGFLATQAEILRSDGIKERALATIAKQHPNWTINPSSIELQVRDSPKSAVLDLAATGPDPEVVRAFLNSLMDEYLTFRKDSRTLSSYTALSTVTEDVTKLQQDMRKQDERIRDFQLTNNLMFLQEQGNSAGSYLARIDKQLADLRTEFKLLQLLQPDQLKEMVNRSTDTSLRTSPLPGEASARSILMDLAGPQADYFKATQQIAIYRAKLEELSQYLRPLHPKINKLNQEITALEKLVGVYRQLSLDQLENRKQSLQIQIQNLEAAYKEWDIKATEASRSIAEFERMKRELQRNQSLYERLLNLIQTVDLSKNLAQESVSILEKASEPKPVNRGLKTLLLGLVAGLFVGFGILYLIEMFDDRFATITELRDHLTEIVLGQIPNIKGKKKRRLLEMLQPQVESEHHIFIESFRNLRSSLLFMFETGTRPKTILITSTAPAEGKSTVAANLACTMAHSGAKVLLVDADLRCGALHEFFDLAQEPGLAEVLSQEIHYSKVIQPTKVPNLSLMPSGESKINPSELFLSPSSQVFLREVSQQYDYILIDSVPVLAADDTTSLAPSIDGVVFVVRASFTSARSARDAIDSLHQRNVRILGLIFNCATRSSGEQYYYYYYRYYSHASRTKRGKGANDGKPDAATPAAPKAGDRKDHAEKEPEPVVVDGRTIDET